MKTVRINICAVFDQSGMSIVASGLVGLSGLVYGSLGASMLAARMRWGEHVGLSPYLASLYPSMFKRFRVVSEEVVDCEVDESGMRQARDLVNEDLGFRMLAYLLLLLGLCRLVAAFYWGCGYMLLGLATCVAEIAFVSNELLRHESVFLHRAMGVIFETGVFCVLYISCCVPYCT